MNYLLNMVSNPADCVLHKGTKGALWLGRREATTVAFLHKHHITAVISLCPTNQLNGTLHYRFKVRDHIDDTPVMAKLVPEVTQLIHQLRTAGHNVLVHCRAGIQRAPTMVIMYLNRYMSYTKSKSINVVRQTRPIAFVYGLHYTFDFL